MSYITVEELANEGVGGNDSLITDAWIAERISIAQSFIEMITGRFFEKRSMVLKVDGPGHDTIFLPYPPISVSAITSIAISGEVVDAADYEVIMPSFPDGRFNPKVRKLATYAIWPKGKSNIVITGNFGFVDTPTISKPDGTVPVLVRELCKRLVMWNLPSITDSDAQKAGMIIEEQLKDYRVKLSDPASYGVGTFSDSKIDNLIAMFKKRSIITV